MSEILISSTDGYYEESSRKRIGKTQFLSSFQELFSRVEFESDAGLGAMLEDSSFIRARSGNVKFQPARFGLTDRVQPLMREVFQAFSHLEFEGSVGRLKELHKSMRVHFQKTLNQTFKENGLSTYHEIRVEFGLEFKMSVVNEHQNSGEIEFLFSQNSSLSLMVKRICILSEFLSCMKGVEDFHALYQLAPQRAVDMFSKFLKDYSQASFGFRVARKKVTWYFEPEYQQYLDLQP